MKKLAFFAVILFGGFFSAGGQIVPTQPTPQPAQDARELARRNEQVNRRFDEMRNGGNRTVAQGTMREVFFERIVPLYRKPTKEELQLLAPNAEDLKNYAAFLKQSNTGIVKLAADFGCAENPTIVVATENCLKYSMPGAGSSFSFRVNNYRIRRLADLTFSTDGFYTTGVLLHGILVNVGDVPIEQASLDTKGVKFLVDFVALSDFRMAYEMEKQIVAGFEHGGFTYRGSLPMRENATYFLRSVAYRGDYFRAVGRVTYNELDFDKREDILVAFRVIRRDADGSITLLWKELDSKKSPKIKLEKEERNNLKESNFAANAK